MQIYYWIQYYHLIFQIILGTIVWYCFGYATLLFIDRKNELLIWRSKAPKLLIMIVTFFWPIVTFLYLLKINKKSGE